MSHTDAMHMKRVVQGVTELITLSMYAMAKAERYQKMITERNAEQFMTCIKMPRRQRSQLKTNIIRDARLTEATIAKIKLPGHKLNRK